jgi:ATP-binding cassette subfamily F protein 3
LKAISEEEEDDEKKIGPDGDDDQDDEEEDGGEKKIQWEVATEKNRGELRTGTFIQAKYSGDGAWYDAIIEQLIPSTGMYSVTFTEYGNTEDVGLASIKIRKEAGDDDDAEIPKLLTAPVCIGDFIPKKKVKKAEEAVVDRGPNKKELRRAAKEKSAQELALKREKARKERMKQMKLTAMQTYLASSSKGKSKEINIEGFSMATPDSSNELLTDAALRLVEGRRYGLIGRNGIGKTTLLRMIANYEVPGFPTFMRVIHVEQEVRGSMKSTVVQRVLKADIERTLLLAEEKRLQNEIDDREKISKYVGNDAKKREKAEAESKEMAQLLQKVYGRMKEIDAWGAESRAAGILSGLGFTQERMQMKTKELSGGWRMRVALACALFIEPDLLLLDEPTNHLDFPAVLWLEKYLNSYSKTLLVVSHDRQFVNNVITDVMFLHNKTLEYYRGDYTAFEKTRAEKLANQQRTFEAQQTKKDHIQKFIDKFRYNAKRASLVQSRIKTVNRMELLEEVLDDPTFQFEFPEPEPLAQAVVTCNRVKFGYSRDKILLEDVTCNVDMKSRIGMLGANGVGKSTLLKLLVGELEALDGQIVRNSSARIATFAQHHMDGLKPHYTPLEMLMEIYPKNHPQIMRRHLGMFGLSGDLALQRISSLSGGQKSRVAFSIVTFKKPHVIIMDEPTNHLDMETIDALIMAVTGFGGGILLVSHDQHFLQQVGTEFWAVSNGKCKRFDDFDAAKKHSYSL